MSTLSLQTKKKRRPLPVGTGKRLWSDCQKMQYCYRKVGANGSYIRKGTEEIKVSAIPVKESDGYDRSR